MRSFFMGCKASVVSNNNNSNSNKSPPSPTRVQSISVDSTSSEDEVAALTSTTTSSLVRDDMFLCTGMLGTGGFGRVFAAKLVQTNKYYAVKEINKKEIMTHKSGLSMIFGEMEAMKNVNHRFIVNLHFTFQNRKSCFFVMDLKSGSDLRHLLKKKEEVREEAVAFYVACISSALEHLHSRNIIHRDIKPENILLDDRGYPYLTDFGVAYVRSDTSDEFGRTLTCTLASGTKQYLAPEVFCKGHIHGPEMDYWALGVVVYELLYGRRPFEKHCNLEFIKYIEDALESKKKRMHETRLLELSMPAMVSPSTDRDSCSSTQSLPPYDSNESLRAAMQKGMSRMQQPLASPLSPQRAAQNNYNIIVPSMIRNNGSLQLRNLGAGSPQLRTFTAGSPQLGGGSSSQRSARGSPSLAYCSTANYTNFSIDWERGSPSPSPSPSPSLNASPGFTPIEQHESESQSGANGLQERQRARCVTPDQVSSDKLPQIRQDSSRASPVGLFLAPRHADDKKKPAMFGAHMSFNENEERYHCEEDEEDPEIAMFAARLPPGDHWLVDSSLKRELVMHFSKMGSHYTVSDICVQVLRGLFDIRPSYRLGCRNYEKLKNHSWFAKCGIPPWDELLDRSFIPAKIPRESEIKDAHSRIVRSFPRCTLDELDTVEIIDSKTKEPVPDFTEHTQAKFEGLFFVNPMYLTEAPSPVTKTSTIAQDSSGTSSTTSIPPLHSQKSVSATVQRTSSYTTKKSDSTDSWRKRMEALHF